MQQDYEFRKSYTELVKDYYASELALTNFKTYENLEDSRLKINKWVENNTNNRIKDLIKAGNLDTTTRLIITNAVYFKGRWMYQFDIGDSKEDNFYTGNKNVKADYMTVSEANVKYFEGDDLKILELPYQGEEFSMMIILPDEKGGIRNLESNFSDEDYSGWVRELKLEIVDVSIPKFKLESEFKLSEKLSRIGMEIAFTNDADFSGMIEPGKEYDMEKKLKIKDVIHKSFIEINEVGTEASAATAVVFVEITGLAPPVENKKVFTADHPFIFLIKENSTNTILFLGRMTDPKPQ